MKCLASFTARKRTIPPNDDAEKKRRSKRLLFTDHHVPSLKHILGNKTEGFHTHVRTINTTLTKAAAKAQATKLTRQGQYTWYYKRFNIITSHFQLVATENRKTQKILIAFSDPGDKRQ